MIALLIILFRFCKADDAGLADESYILNFDSPIYVCPDEESQAFLDTSQVEVQRFNETCSYMKGGISFLKGMQDSTMIEVVIDKEVGGNFEMLTSYEICDLCKELGDPESPYRQYLKYFGFPDGCPFPAETYSIQDMVADTRDLPINSATVGRYQVTININQNPSKDCLNEKNFIACFKLDFIIEHV